MVFKRSFQRNLVLLLFFLLFSTVCLAGTPEIVKESASKVVMIITFDKNNQPLGIGSGFYISTDGQIATNYHVIKDASSAIVKEINSDEKYPVKYIQIARSQFDVAIIKIDKKTKPVKLGDDDISLVGDKVIAIGNPEGLEGTVSEGIISGFRKITDEFRIIQVSAPISPGSSGGPLFDSNGNVIGITTASIIGGQNLNFAIPVSALKKVMQETCVNKKLDEYKYQESQSDLFADTSDKSLVKINDISGDGGSGYSGYISFSVYNGLNNNIKNLKVIFVFYQHQLKDKENSIPYQYEAYKIDTIIPSRLAKIVKEPLSVSMNVSYFKVEYRIIDFQILPTSDVIDFK